MAVKRIDVPNQARFLTYSCYKRQRLFADSEIRDLYLLELQKQSDRLDFDVIAYVVMPEHVHLIVVPNDGRISPVLRGLKQGFARDMLARMREERVPVLSDLIGSQRKPVFWQRGGGYDRVMRSESDLREKIEYIHMNPVRRGLVTCAVDWAWSSARDYSGIEGVVQVRTRW